MSDSGQIVAICERARGRLDELVEEIGAAVRAEVPSYRPGGELDDADVRATLARYLTLILDEVEGRAVSGAELDPVMRRRAGEGISLEDMLHSYRVGISRLWEVLAREAADDAAATQGLVAATPRLFALLDRISLRASEIQHEIALRDARRREQVRASLLDSVLTTDTSLGPAFWDAVALLGIPREGRFRIVEVDRAGDDDGASGGLDLEPALLAGGAERCWFRLGPSSQTGLVALRPGRDLDTEGPAAALRARGARGGLSEPFDAIAATPAARAQAHVAAAAAGPSRPLVVYERDPVPVLLASAPVAARALARSTLAPVLALPAERGEPVLTTLRSWLDHDLSVSATAEALFVHRNTVNYRLRRFEELTGRDLADVAWRSQVLLALEAEGMSGAR